MAKYDVFISYASKDTVPPRVCTLLEEKGVKCWIAPRDINPGTPYARAIMQGLSACHTVLVFISTNALKSEDVLNEIDNAHGLKKTIVPIFLENIELLPEFRYYLKRKQWINAYDGNTTALLEKLGSIFEFSSHPNAVESEYTISNPATTERKKVSERCFDIYLTAVGRTKLQVVKYLIDTFDLSLKESMEKVEKCNTSGGVLLATVENIEDFRKLRDELADIEATVEYREHE